MLSCLFLPLIAISLFNLFYGIKNRTNAVGLHCLNFIYLYIYGLGGFYSVFQYPDELELYSNFFREDFIFFITAFLVTFSYFLSLFSYKFGFSINVSFFDKFLSYCAIRNISLFSIILCFLFIFIYISQYGGFIKALGATAAIRSGFGDLEEGASGATFVKYLMPIGVFPLLFSAYKIFNNKNNIYKIIFIISFFQVFISFLLMGGRTRIVIYLASLMILYFYVKGHKLKILDIIKSSPLIILGIFFIVFGKQLFSSFGAILTGESVKQSFVEREKENFIESAIGYFCHRTYSIEAALINFRDSNFLYGFKDNFLSFFFLIPERITGIVKPDSISPYNTEVLTGIYQPMIPPGILGYGIYSLWIPGLFIVSFFYSFIFGVLDRVYLNNLSKKYYLVIILPFLVVWALYGSTGDFKILINSFSYILLFFMLLFFYFILVRAMKK